MPLASVHDAVGFQVTDPAVRSDVETMLAKVAEVPHVTQVVSPYSAEGASQISDNGTTGFATVTFDKLANDISTSLSKHFVSTAQSAGVPRRSHDMVLLALERMAQQIGGLKARVQAS